MSSSHHASPKEARRRKTNVAGSSNAAGLMDENVVVEQMKSVKTAQIVAAPYLYVIARAEKTPVVVAGTWLDEAQRLSPTWKIEGNRVDSRDDQVHALVGRNVARELHLAPGSEFALDYLGRTAKLTVAGDRRLR